MESVQTRVASVISADATIYQLKVTLMEVVPRIWRRLQVPGQIELSMLHETLQIVMGWSNSHLHRFEIAGRHYGDGGISQSEAVALQALVPPRLDISHSQLRRPWNTVPSVFFYEYDFGAAWKHEIRVEKVVRASRRKEYPRCLAGARAAPSEMCCGAVEYRDWLSEASYREIMDDGPLDFDPEHFDRDTVNAMLRQTDPWAIILG